MMSALFSGYWISVVTGCGKYPLPAPSFACVGIFAFKGVGERNITHAALKVALVLSLYQIEVLAKLLFHRRGKHGVAVLVPLAGPNENLVAGEIDVFDPQLQTFHQSEARSLEKHRHEPIGMVEGAENRFDFPPCQYHRKPVRPLCSNNTLDVSDLFTQDLAIEKQDSV